MLSLRMGGSPTRKEGYHELSEDEEEWPPPNLDEQQGVAAQDGDVPGVRVIAHVHLESRLGERVYFNIKCVTQKGLCVCACARRCVIACVL